MNRTGIEYLTHTWNPIAMRCTRVSDGCDNCWHLRMAHRHAANPRLTDAMRAARRGDCAPYPVDLYGPLRHRQPAVIGVQFMGDLFHDDVAEDLIAWVFAVMAFARQHTFVLLTKRPVRARDLIASDDFADLVESSVSMTLEDELSPIGPGRGWNGLDRRRDDARATAPCFDGAPVLLPNLIFGTSIEDQPTADERLIYLRDTPAAKRFVSYEPAIGGWDPIRTYAGNMNINALGWLDLIVAGAETGPGKRPAELGWFRDVRDQCKAAGVPYFFKVDSDGNHTLDGAAHEEMP